MSKLKPTIGLVFGGNSSEHDVSIQSAKSIYKALSNPENNERFTVNPIYIDKYGFWGDYQFSKSILSEDNISNPTIKNDGSSINSLTNLSNESEKIDRLREINNLVGKTAKERNLRYKDSLQEILIEDINSKNNSQLMGRTRTNRLTFFSNPSNNEKSYQPGEIVNIKINEIRPFSLTGSVA